MIYFIIFAVSFVAGAFLGAYLERDANRFVPIAKKDVLEFEASMKREFDRLKAKL